MNSNVLQNVVWFTVKSVVFMTSCSDTLVVFPVPSASLITWELEAKYMDYISFVDIKSEEESWAQSYLHNLL